MDEAKILKEVEKMRQDLLKAKEDVGRLTADVVGGATVISIVDDGVMCVTGMGQVIFPNPPEGRILKTINPGDTVTLNESNQIIGRLDPLAPFRECRVVEHIDGSLCRVEIGGDNVIVYSGRPENRAIERGATVYLDGGGRVIIKELPAEKIPPVKTGITWDSIGGLEDAKREIQDAVISPIKHAKLFEKYGRRAARGIVMHGPPGCGKTLLGKATATAVADGGDGMFVYVKAPELLSSYVGMAEMAIRNLFARARAHKKETGITPVIFLDEADAILYRRGSGISSDVDRTIVPSFLTEMDGLEDSAALVILSTNRLDTLDPAVIRDGRIDVKIKISRPTPNEVLKIFEVAYKHMLIKKGISVAGISEASTEALCSDDRVLKVSNGKGPIRLRDKASGAMCVNVANRAAGLAMRRDMENGKAVGITLADAVSAVDEIFQQNLAIVPA